MARSWPKEIYIGRSVRDLILVSFYVLDKKEVGFEALLKNCFSLFPAKFSFESLEWPDARKLGRPLRALRREGFVKGDEVFSLTKKGERKASETLSFLRQKKLELH